MKSEKSPLPWFTCGAYTSILLKCHVLWKNCSTLNLHQWASAIVYFMFFWNGYWLKVIVSYVKEDKSNHINDIPIENNKEVVFLLLTKSETARTERKCPIINNA